LLMGPWANPRYCIIVFKDVSCSPNFYYFMFILILTLDNFHIMTVDTPKQYMFSIC